MTTETKTTSTLNETAENLNTAKEAKNIFETVEEKASERRRNFAIAAGIGAAVGVGITATSERANTKTVAVTAAFGALGVAVVYNNPAIPFCEDGIGEMALVGSAIALETTLFGCVLNVLAGDKPAEAE